MIYAVSNVKVPFGTSEEDFGDILARKIGLPPSAFSFSCLRRSLDCRKGEGYWVYRFMVDTEIELHGRDVATYSPPVRVTIPEKKLPFRPVVVGMGPAGIFASLLLARSGNPPIILERGKAVEERVKDVEALSGSGVLNPESNVCYGEGGAGAYSDGKLNTGIKSPYISFVLEEFVKHGAPQDILIDAKPHIGSDLLPKVLSSFREELLSLGADILFSSRFLGFSKEEDGLSIAYENEGSEKAIWTKACFLAYGHSPFDTAKALYEQGLLFEPKDFSIGLRIEFPQKDIDLANYRENYGKTPLPSSSFQSVTHLPNGRSMYSFCMCPGGKVLNSSTDLGTIVTNGASERNRDAENGNAALLVSLRVDDYFRGHPLDGYVYRSMYERRAFRADKPYFAPSTTLSAFLSDVPPITFGSVRPSYAPGVYLSDFHGLLPAFALSSLRKGIAILREHQPIYRNGDAVLTGVETRSSSPVRIPRNDLFESNVPGLFPIGEGASYAGGITSAAVDGVRSVLKVLADRF